MQTIVYDMLRWSLGFVIVSMVYLMLVWWLGRKIRAARKRRQADAESAAPKAPDGTPPDADAAP